MRILEDNQQVYSIQLGPPAWIGSADSDRSLVMRSNGAVPDAFSQGDLPTLIRANLEALFGIYQGSPGKILLYIGAPGHDYQWEYEDEDGRGYTVRSQVINFLEQHWPRW
jgi:hypothetical protein